MSNITKFVQQYEAALTKKTKKYGVNFAVEVEFLKTAAKNLTASPEVVLKSALEVWASGLSFNPSLKHLVLIPYKGEVKAEIMYQGLLFLASQNANISQIYSDIVRKEDNFTAQRGNETKLQHAINPFSESEVVGSYAFVKYADGSIDFELLNMNDIKAIKSVAKTQNIWGGGFKYEMYKKAALRRLLKRVLNSKNTSSAIMLDDESYDFKQSRNTENTDFEIVESEVESEKIEIQTVSEKVDEAFENQIYDPETQKPILTDAQFNKTLIAPKEQIKTVLDKYDMSIEQQTELVEKLK